MIAMTRRSFVPSLAAGAAAAAYAQDPKPVHRKGRIKQGITAGCLKGMSFEDQCRHAARLGVVGFDLRGTADWPTLKKYGLVSSMVPNGGGNIPDALNRVENHDRIEKTMHEMLDLCAAAGAPNLITFSGNRRGQKDEEGMDNCVTFLNKVKAHAEDKNVTICMEYLNSKVNHKDYQFDHMSYGVDVCKRVNSPRVKILYDMYHVQIMEGDIIRMMRDNIQWIGHFHTAGNPGRHEMDDTQEMNYRGIIQAIAATGYQGFVSHEYSPLRDPLQSLEETLTMFDV